MFDNLKLAFKMVKVYKLVKNELEHIQEEAVYKELIENVETVIKGTKGILAVLPEGKEEITEIVEKFKGILK